MKVCLVSMEYVLKAERALFLGKVLLVLALGCCLQAGAEDHFASLDFELRPEMIEAREAQMTVMEGTTPAQWRVIWTEDPARNATISWSTRAPGSRHYVCYDTESRGGDDSAYRQRKMVIRSGAYTLGEKERGKVPGAFYHHVNLTDLRPSTTYYFVLKSDETVSRELHFTTAPGDARPFSLFYGGDSRSDQAVRMRMNMIMSLLLEKNPGIIGFTHGGDYIVSGERWEQWEAWLSQHELTTSESGRVLPIIPTRGNHDDGPLYDQIFNFPGGKGRNYFFTQLGTDAVLFTLDNCDRDAPVDPIQAKWLAAQLRWLRPANRWVTVSYHIPIYPAVKDPVIEKRVWPPIFDRYDVDLVMESDGHCVKRTVPIRGDRPDPTGIVYIGEGGLGAPQRNPHTSRWHIKPPGFVDKGDHVQVLDFSDTGLRVRVLFSDGEVPDDYMMKPRF